MVFFQRLLSRSIYSSIMSKYNVVFVLGGPGAGKGTQCAKIVEEFKYVHLSAGDLLREERSEASSQYGKLIDDHIKAGTIVPVEITCSLLERAMKNSGKQNFLIDGFPRNENNLQGWENEMNDKVDVNFVLYFSCPLETCTERCLARGAGGSGRADDNLETLKKRFNTFLNETMPIVEHYKKKGMVQTVEATVAPEEVFETVKALPGWKLPQ